MSDCSCILFKKDWFLVPRAFITSYDHYLLHIIISILSPYLDETSRRLFGELRLGK